MRRQGQWGTDQVPLLRQAWPHWHRRPMAPALVRSLLPDCSIVHVCLRPVVEYMHTCWIRLTCPQDPYQVYIAAFCRTDRLNPKPAESRIFFQHAHPLFNNDADGATRAVNHLAVESQSTLTLLHTPRTGITQSYG